MNNSIQKNLSKSFTTTITGAVDARIYLGLYLYEKGLAMQTWRNDFNNSVNNV